MSENNQLRDSRPGPPPEILISSAEIAENSSGPGRRVGRFLGKVKNVIRKTSKRSEDSRSRSRSRDLALLNVDREGASSTPNIGVQSAPSGVEQVTDPQSALQSAKEGVKHLHPLSGPVRSGASAAQSAPAGLDAADNFQDTYLKPLRLFDAVIGEIADVHPYAKMALGVLSCASKIILAQVDRDKAVDRLVDKLDQVYSFIIQDETLGQISSMRTILGQVSQQTLECAHFIRDYSEKKNFWTRLGKNIGWETDDTIRQYSDVLDALLQNFRDQVARDVVIYVHRTGELLELSGMTYAAGAGLDTTKECLPETRTEILSQIMDWVNSTGDNVPNVLWLSGPAGTGKSAIAHTIAKWFNDVGGLGSCYCFDRDGDGEHLHKKVFSTIARDLADRHPEMRRALADAVQNASALKTTVDVIQQWQKLFMEPLGKLSESTVGPIVVVIDALDESGATKTRSDLLRILAGKIRNSTVPQITELPKNFRFIVTSRPLQDIENAFSGARHVRRMSMDDIPAATAERDIRAYVSKKLEELSDFGSKEFAALAQKADGLFEWARLACEILEAPPPGVSRRHSFNAVVSLDPEKGEHLLYHMYHLILTEIMPKDKYATAEFHQKQLAVFHSVMGQILGAAEPLPLNSLTAMRDHFPDQREHYEVELMVKHMGSLLSGTTNSSNPIRPLHVSFRDFLTNPSCSGEFFVDVPKVQRDLAFASLRVMEHGLRFNICDFKSSYLPNCENTELPEQVQRCISPHLSYACRFWAAHVRTQDFDAELAQEVKSFFDHERTLFWLELLGLVNGLSGAVAALPLIVQWLKGHDEYQDVSSTAIDVQRFIQVFGGTILHSMPHLYISALPFSPVNSAISRKFATSFPNTLHLAYGRDLTWTVVQSVLSGHTKEVLSASFSPDGTRIVTGSSDLTVRLWDAATGQPVGGPLRGHTGAVTSVSYSPNGTCIASCSEDRTVRLWDAATGQSVDEPLQGHIDVVNSVSFSPDGTLIATGSDDTTVRLWDTATGQPVGEPLRGHIDAVTSVSFSPDGTRIVSCSEDQTIQLWDAATQQPVNKSLRGHIDVVTSASFSPDGTRIVSCSEDQTFQLWDAATGKPVSEPLRGHIQGVTSVSFSPDGTRIVTGSQDKTVQLWDAAGQPVGKPLRGHTGAVTSVSFSPDGTRIVSCSEDRTIRLWDAMTDQPISEPLQGHTNHITSVSFSPDGTRIVTGSWDMTVQLWDAATGQPVTKPMEGHTYWVTSVSFSPDGTRIATGSWDNTVRLWDAATGKLVGKPLQGHTKAVKSVSFSPDGTLIVTGSDDRTVQLWDTATGRPVRKPMEGHTRGVTSVAFSPDGTRIATGSLDRTVRLWDAATGKSVGEPLQGHTGGVISVSFSPNGTRIMTGSSDMTAQLWDAATGQAIGKPLRGHTGGVSSVSFSPDGARIVTGSWDKSARLWDAATGQPVGEPLLGHTDFVTSVSFSLDGTRIVTGSNDRTVRLWDAARGQPLHEYTKTDRPAFSDEGRTMPPTEDAITMTTSTSNSDFIRFSSSTTHALHNAAELIVGTGPGDRRSTSFLLGDDGWMIGPNRRLLFWVPPASRERFYTPFTTLVIPRGCAELDLSRMAHGRHWWDCRAKP